MPLLCYPCVCDVGGSCQVFYLPRFCSAAGCMAFYWFAAPRFCARYLPGVPYYGLCLVLLGCNGTGGLSARMGALGVVFPLPLLPRLPAARLMKFVCCGCVRLCRCLSDGVVLGMLVCSRSFGSWVRLV
jgi:hypothetical protein